MFKLIRDNIPELMKEAGKTCNYAKAETDELYMSLLNGKLIEEVNEYLATGSIEELVDIVTVIKTIAKFNNISEENFEILYNSKLAKNGGFENKYIGFFPDNQAPVQAPTQASNNSEAE